MMRVALFAADDFSLPLCKYLADKNMLACLVTQPDKPRGRGCQVGCLPVGIEADKCGVPIFQPKSLKDDGFKNDLKSIGAEIPIVAAYGLFIPKWIRNWNPYPCINVHPSILPRWRGADPVRSAILAGDNETAVTLHFTERSIDTGDIILESEKLEINSNKTFHELKLDLAQVAVKLVDEFLQKLDNSIIPDSDSSGSHPGKTAIRELFNCTAQDESLVTFSQKLEKPMMWINWDMPSREINNLIRGLSKTPGARTGNPQKPLRILRADTIDKFDSVAMESKPDSTPGEIIYASNNKLLVKCSDGLIRIITLQPADKREMSAGDFINGYRVKAGDKITNF